MHSLNRCESSPLVYVVILNWNGWRDTLQCLRSLQELDYSNYRVLVVDNGSTDESVGRVSEEYPDVRLLETGANLGFAGGNNVGIRHALAEGSELVWLLNNDTIVAPATLSAMVRLACSATEIGLVGSVLRYAHDPAKVQAWGGGRVHWWIGIPQHAHDARGARHLDYIVGASLLAKRAVFESIGLLDEGFFLYWEDADFALRAQGAGWQVAVAEESVVFHKEGGSASAGARVPSLSAELYHLRSLARLFRKHHRLWPVPVAIRGLLEVPRQLAYGRPRRILPVLKTIAAAFRAPGPQRDRHD